MKEFKFLASVFIVLFLVVSCAKRGTITGGEKDIAPPKIISSSPKNLNTNFNQKSIKITFDEFVKVKDIQKNLIVSPPFSKPVTILPQGSVSKTITIKINDSLVPNTTYSLNFGESISDNNEGNVLKNFKYVFATGSQLDSLSVEGIIKDSYEKKTDNYVNVMLYEVDEKFNDSTIFKQNPRYITNTLDSSSTFKIENIKAGKYKLVALKEKSTNYKFDPKKDKIGFFNQIISVPDKSIFEVELFKEDLKFDIKKPSQVSANRILVPYEGNAQNAKLTASKNKEIFNIKTTKVSKSDSLYVWFQPIDNDSISLEASNTNYLKSNIVKFRKLKQDTLNISPVTKGIIHPKQSIQFNTFTPLTTIDKEKIKLIRKDSSEVKYSINYDEFNSVFELIFESMPNEKYTVLMEENAIIDYLNNKSKKNKYTFNTKGLVDYGNLKINLKNVKSFPVIIELTDEKGKIIESSVTNEKTEIEFLLIEPQKYWLRTIYDKNNNGKRDTGSYLENRQPEEVIHFPTEIDVRANWDVNQDVDLSK